jgi:hypothetical protein
MPRIQPLSRKQLPWIGRLFLFGAERKFPALADWVRIKSATPLLLFGEYVHELSLMFSKQLDPRIRELAGTRAASLIGCPG